ncbi:phage protease [Serratia plymuthica]|jgi:phage I-like protein|uniref:phage protease n=1 Tax=Serratia TaxID=613 RepID=UPI0021770CF6|nr:phage protease [Serratia marcescens]CAI2036806.1 Mu-like prophage I protein [Serratia marcescens]
MPAELLALCFELPDYVDNQIPAWLPMLPIGPFTGRDGRAWVNNEPEAVIAKSLQYNHLPFDMEHATEIKGPKGEDAPAYGWIEDLKIQGDQIWARVAWNADGEKIIQGKKYRYYSPAFYFTADGQVTQLSSVGLTNKPNLLVPALNSENTDMKLHELIAAALGLGAEATVESGVTAIQSLKSAEQVALNRAQNPDLSAFVPKETHQLALNRAESAEDKLKELAEKDAEVLVDGAIATGKVAPANREMYLATCRSEEGRKQFTEFVQGAPVIVNSDPIKKKPGHSNQELTDVELATCRSMGISKETFLAEKTKREVQQ